MIFFNDIINAKGTPSITEDIITNRPDPSTAGRLFIQTDSPYNIYRDTGTNWQQISGTGGGGGVSQIIAGSNITISPTGGTGAVTINSTGGGGGSQNIDSVLNQGGAFTTNRGIDCSNYEFDIFGFSNFTLSNSIGYYLQFITNSFSLYDTANNVNYLQIELNNGNVLIGDFVGSFGSSHLKIDNTNDLIYFSAAGFPTLLVLYGVAVLGDPYELSNATQLIVSDTIQKIYTANNGVNNGLSLDFNPLNFIFRFGDFEGLSSGYLEIDNAIVSTKFGSNDYVGLYATYSDGVSVGYMNGNGGFMKFNVDDGIGIGSETFMFNLFGIKIYESGTSDRSVKIGDYDFANNGAFLEVNDYYNKLIWQNIESWVITSTAIITTSSGSVSGQHLKVTIGGVNYVIELRNP